jgi:hypothetical protein
VGQDAVPVPDSGTFGAVDAGAIPAVATLEGTDAAFASGAPLDCSSEGWPVFVGSPCLGGFAFAGPTFNKLEIKTVDSDDSSAPQSVRVLRRFVALSPRVKYGLLHGNQ